MAPDLSARITGLFVGKVENLWDGKPPSAINKKPISGPIYADLNGFLDDAQADLTVHGGPEKAILHYAADHLPFWRNMFPEKSDVFKASCFGENISTEGLTEHNLCIGDVLEMGSLVVQICQGRQPCWKLAAYTGLDALPAHFQLSGKTGWYYRVIQPGSVSVGDTIRLTDRPHNNLSVFDVTQARFNPKIDAKFAKYLSEIEAISEVWRAAFRERADKS